MEQYEKVFNLAMAYRELFDTGLKYLNKLIENRTKIFESNIFVIHKVLLKITKILSHKYLEPYGNRHVTYTYNRIIGIDIKNCMPVSCNIFYIVMEY